MIHTALIAPRPKSLDGLTIGLLANGKKNADLLLDHIYQMLSQRYKMKGVVRLNKNSFSIPAPKPILDELTTKADVVITATGE